jgi:two-component system phosphate regulon response regulator PhoB
VILSVFRISSNLERIGDYAKNIAKRSEAIMDQPPVNGTGASLRRMARQVELMLKDVLDAYIQRDADLALDVRDRDIEVDQMYSALFREYLTFMMEDPRNITTCMHLHFMAKNIERMGDHATSIAEQVIYWSPAKCPMKTVPSRSTCRRTVRRADRGGNGTMAGEPLVLVVEDEPAQARGSGLQHSCRRLRGRDRRGGRRGACRRARDAARRHHPGLDAAQRLRDRGLPPAEDVGRHIARIPVIMLSARSEETDKVRGLETGADDYVVKPYSVAELLARLRTQLRRIRPAAVGERLEFEDIVVDLAEHRVFRDGISLSLGPTEFRLLTAFMERPGRVWSREQLLDRVWGRDIYVDSRTVDVHVGRLRKALRAADAGDPIRTVRGAGYALG